MSYAPLHVQSSFSPNWGVRSLDDLCSAASTMGFTTLALTDRNGLYGIPHFLDCARQHNLAPIIGCEAVHSGQRAILLARNSGGYANLCRILSDLHCCDDFALSEALVHYRQGLTILSDHPHVLGALRRQGREYLYVELSPDHQMHRALTLARNMDLPPVATSRALLLDETDFEVHRLLRAIALNTRFSRLPLDETASGSDFLLSSERMSDYFPHCPLALTNSIKIAAECHYDWGFSKTIFPAFRDQNHDQVFSQLNDRARQGALWRYGEIGPKVEERLVKELDIIRSKGFADYFLVVEEIAKQSPRTCGRGSAAASLVAYCLGITHVDPIAHNLFFERFLNEGRVDPPDIDIDFPWDERDAVIDFAFARYGTRRAAMVANQVGFKGRSSIREVAKVFGFTDAEIKTMTSRISGYWKADQTTGAVSEHPLFKGEEFSSEWQMILRLASRLDGQLRHLSLHCGGLVIVPDEIRRYVPVEISAKGLPMIQWEKDQAENSGLVKIDILGNRSLAVIRDALTSVKTNTGIDIDYANWKPLANENTRKLLRSGDTMGCFYIESPATRLLLKRMWHDHPNVESNDLFDHLVMASSIIRPAANRFILQFIDRMRGEAWQHLHPLLDDVLGETYGIAIYQEQITQMAMALADFSAFEGDQLRKIISKKHKEQTLADYRQKFKNGALHKGVSPEVIEAIWEQILSFGGYSFCKPHSASYALVSCKSAYLKANHPAEFVAAVISNQGGFYSPFAYLSEARRMSLRILPPEINSSDHHYTGRLRELRIGFMQIQGLSHSASQALRDERVERGVYRSFQDFIQRVSMDQSDVRLLIKAGCFDTLEGKEKRPALLWQLLNRGQGSSGQQGSLFESPQTQIPIPPPYDDRMVLNQELEALGILASTHPLTLYRREISTIKPIKACQINDWTGRYVTMIGWWVTGKTVQDKNGRPMEFISFEDTTGIYDATFFPKSYERFCQKLTRHRPFVLKGKVEEEFSVATLTVEWVDFLHDYKESPSVN
jgi:DNA-directed DNA polymerase III PolC